MKKTIYFFVAFLLCLTSCVEPLGPNDQLPKAEETGLVAVTMQLTIPHVELSAGTKANTFFPTPQIESIHVAVFGTSGYPQAYTLAEPMEPSTSYATTNGDVYHFQVLLPVYDGEAHVHIIANGPESIPFVEQDEESIMTQMTTTNKVGAYWARVVLPNGILPNKDENGIMKTDPNGNFEPNAETVDKFRNLTLIRNFAQIKLHVESGAGISDVSWALVNDLQYGAVAPVDPDSVVINILDPVSNVVVDSYKTSFIDNYKDYTFDPRTGKMKFKLEGATDSLLYNGYAVSAAVNYNVSDDMAFPARARQFNPNDEKGDSLWCYERPDPNKTNPTFILMKAIYGNDTDYTYYRVDLMDEALGGYFPLFRNYKYEIKIHKVGNRGDSSPTQAVLHANSGNISQSAEAKTLTDVSDGISRLYIEYVEKTFTNPRDTTRSFWVYYVPDITDVDANGNPKIDNTKIEVSVKETEVNTALANNTITWDGSKSQATGVVNATTGVADAMYFYNFNLKGQTTTDLMSVIQVKANNGKTGVYHSTLYRDVTVRVMKKMNMSLSLKPNPINEGINEKTVLHIALTDTLQESMFPLEFYIEDSNRTLNPTGKDGIGNPIIVPVKTGKSIYDANNPNSYYYIRTVNYSEYKPMLIAWREAAEDHLPTTGIIDFTTEFKTIKENGATTLYVDNEYFNIDSVKLTTKPTFKWDVDGAVSANASQRTVTVQFKCTASGTWRLTTSSTDVTVSPASGTGSRTITVTIPSNLSGTAPVTHTVTASLSGQEDQVLTIVQNIPVVTSHTETKPFTLSNNQTITVTDDNHTGATVSLTRNNFSYNNGYYYNGTGTPRTMTFTPAEGITITNISMSWYQGNSNYFSPTAITTPFGNFTVNAQDATWSGSYSSTTGLTATFTCRGTSQYSSYDTRRTQVNAISVTYTYTTYE